MPPSSHPACGHPSRSPSCRNMSLQSREGATAVPIHSTLRCLWIYISIPVNNAEELLVETERIIDVNSKIILSTQARDSI